MNILVVHSQDSPLDGQWSRAKWDMVLDLGVAGGSSYQDWARMLNCPVYGLNAMHRAEDSKRLRELMKFARGKIVDDYGLDWWDLNLVFFYQQLDEIILLTRVAREWADSTQITVTRPCFQGSVLRAMFGQRVSTAEPTAWSAAAARVQHYGRVLKKFSVAQLGEILGDKYDPAYSLRRRIAANPEFTRNSVVLVPSAYANASKMVAAYARMVPEQEFLLVATRRSGALITVPPNVRIVSLASYAPDKRSNREVESLLKKWLALLRDMEVFPELFLFAEIGGFQEFPRMLATGLAVRDAWSRVFEHHDISAVFSGDEGNPYVCVPMLLANQRGIATVSVHHGALDGRFRWKSPAADVLLAKSRMEADYLTRICAVAPDKVVLGAPGPPLNAPTASRSGVGDILVFSEPYEIYGGRTEVIYRDLLPPLCRLAHQERRRVVLKLHPFESARERRRFANNILQEQDQAVLDIISGPLTSELLSRTWFGVTVQSTVVTECAVAGIPCFLCGWLAERSLEYAQQFAKFGAGVLLTSADEIADIPQRLAAGSTASPDDLWSPLSPDTLRVLLNGVRETCAAVAAG